MKSLSLMSLVLSAIAIALVIGLRLNEKERLNKALRELLASQEAVDRILIQTSKDRFFEIYRDLGISYAENPSTIEELLSPLTNEIIWSRQPQ